MGAGERRASGVEAQVVEDALRDRGLGDEGDELEPAAAGTGEDVHGEDLPEEVGPRDAAGAPRPVGLPRRLA
jgi:hypothetical protein